MGASCRIGRVRAGEGGGTAAEIMEERERRRKVVLCWGRCICMMVTERVERMLI